jgi:FkbM family methyltransferase
VKDNLLHHLQPANRTHIVDIGAYPIDGKPPYWQMLQQGLCDVVGFEPQLDGFRKLDPAVSENAYYMDHAVGDGETHDIYHCFARGMTSLLRPNERVLNLFNGFAKFGTVEHVSETWSSRLDDEHLIQRIDYLKIDTQGSELMILQNGREKLKDCVAIQVEMPFVPLYHNMPSLGDIDNELRSQGLIPLSVVHFKPWRIDRGEKASQVLDADFLYVRDYTKPDALTDDQLKQLALITRHIYDCPDLCAYCVKQLRQRGALQVAA